MFGCEAAPQMNDDPLEPALSDAPPGPGEEEPSRLYNLVPEMVRKAVITGLGALFMTEEGVRALVKELKLPKEIVGFITSQAEKTKTDLTRVIGEEVRRFFESAALRQEFLKLLSSMTIEVRADVRLKPDVQKSGIADIALKDAKVKRSPKE